MEGHGEVGVPAGPVFDVVGHPTSRGVTWVWAQDDLETASLDRARADLALLFTGGVCPHRVLVYLGDERFVDLRGLRLLAGVAAEVRRCGGALAVVTPPHCLVRMVTCFGLEDQLPVLDSVREAVRWARPRLAPAPGSP